MAAVLAPDEVMQTVVERRELNSFIKGKDIVYLKPTGLGKG